ncbi:hypothetical protein A5724_18070 [Mycobacterium sp. ACS1612]|uniref:hypothetical protein n=1 Tax=Mycobacterium sp. ACS1612 TaxID=1834117 RepID=UPI0007FEE13A|nr:hypothetical protein [Mycobacterium sp. ACS1612]OBF34110.1 hypothetical protein A5724_18070 [Mycobacterium sp. ACS1612]
MRKFALGLASAGAFAAITIGLAGPAMASPDYVLPGRDDAYTRQPLSTTVRPVDSAVQINYPAAGDDISWR